MYGYFALYHESALFASTSNVTKIKNKSDKEDSF